MANIPAHKLSFQNGLFTETPGRTHIAVVKGPKPEDLQEAIDQLTRGNEVFWDPQETAGLKTIRERFKPKPQN